VLDGRLGIVVSVVDELLGCFSAVTTCVVMVGVQTGLFLGSSLATSPRKHMLVMVEVVVLVFIKVRLHFGRFEA